jgi:hypothetical protein
MKRFRSSLSAGPEDRGSSRRQFLRRAGVAGALGAALVGGAEMTGLSSALASSKKTGKPQACARTCVYTYTPRQCNGGKSCPGGECCFTASGPCCSGKVCMARSCASFAVCCPPT